MPTQKQNIKDELARIDPEMLKILEKDSGFRVPEMYFSENPERLIHLLRISEKDAGKSAFRTPDGYFETLGARVQSRISENKSTDDLPPDYFEKLPSAIVQRIRKEEQSATKATKSRVIKLGIRRAIAVAALVSGLALAIWVIVKNQSNNPEKQISKVSTSELEEYLSDQIEYLDDDELSIILATDTEYLPVDDGTDQDDREIEDYLENVDLTTIEDIL